MPETHGSMCLFLVLPGEMVQEALSNFLLANGDDLNEVYLWNDPFLLCLQKSHG